MDEFFVPENLITEKTKEYISPSKKYILTVEVYKTKENCWNYSKGIVKNNEGKILYEIKRNYESFPYKFFEKDGDDWLWCGKTYFSQCFINLTKNEIHDNSDNKDLHFCWANVSVNSSGTLMVVEGCVWAASYEIRFFDISDIEKGWKEIPMKCEYMYVEGNECEFTWIDNNTCKVDMYDDYYPSFRKFYDDFTVEDGQKLVDNYENHPYERKIKCMHLFVHENELIVDKLVL